MPVAPRLAATQAGGLRHLNNLPVLWGRSPTCPGILSQRDMAATKQPSEPRLRAERPCRGRLTIVGLTIDDCCVWRRGTLESSIVNEPIVNWSATPTALEARNLCGPQRNEAIVVRLPRPYALCCCWVERSRSCWIWRSCF
jgi:hypothetical protein